MHGAGTAFFASPQRTSAERTLIERRRDISASTGREQCALFAAHVYTDDSFVIIAGTDHAVRWVRIWSEFVRWSRSRMAIPRRRLAGAGGVWCGVANILCIGVAHTERAKTVRACAVLARVADGDAMLIWGDYRSLTGLLEHLFPTVGMNRTTPTALRQGAADDAAWFAHHRSDVRPRVGVLRHTELVPWRTCWRCALSLGQHGQWFQTTQRIGSSSAMLLVSARSKALGSGTRRLALAPSRPVTEPTPGRRPTSRRCDTGVFDGGGAAGGRTTLRRVRSEASSASACS